MPKETKIELTERQYLGAGYVHVFRHNTTGELVYIPTTKEQYESLGNFSGSEHNPTLVDHTWLYSQGGTLKVDTPDTMLGKDEYVVVDGVAHVRTVVDGENLFFPIEKEKVDERGLIDHMEITKAITRIRS